MCIRDRHISLRLLRNAIYLGAFLRCSSPKHGIPSKLLKAHSGSDRGYSSMQSMLHTVKYLDIYTKFRIFNQIYSIWLAALVNEYRKHKNTYIHWQNWTLEFVFFKGHNHIFSTRFDSWGTLNGLSCVRFDKLLNIPFWPFFGEKRLRNAPIQMALRSNRRLICLCSRPLMRLPQELSRLD